MRLYGPHRGRAEPESPSRARRAAWVVRIVAEPVGALVHHVEGAHDADLAEVARRGSYSTTRR